jgi:hypothetical protein
MRRSDWRWNAAGMAKRSWVGAAGGEAATGVGLAGVCPAAARTLSTTDAMSIVPPGVRS